MKPNEIAPENTVFVILSFEGPDQYSKAGGLGVRVAELSEALAEQGYETHLLFVGDPSLPSFPTPTLMAAGRNGMNGRSRRSGRNS